MRMLCKIIAPLLCWSKKCIQPENNAIKLIESINLRQRTKSHQEHHLWSMVEFLHFSQRTLICFIFFVTKKPLSSREKEISSSLFIKVRSPKLRYRLRKFSLWILRINITTSIFKKIQQPYEVRGYPFTKWYIYPSSLFFNHQNEAFRRIK